MKSYIIRYRYCFVLAVIALLVTASSSPTQAAGPASPHTSMQTAAMAGAECEMGGQVRSFLGLTQTVVIDGDFRYPYCNKWKYMQWDTQVPYTAMLVPVFCYWGCSDYEVRLDSTTTVQSFYQDIAVPANAPGGHRTLSAIIFFKNVPPNPNTWDNLQMTITELPSGPHEIVQTILPAQGYNTSYSQVIFPVQNDYRGKTIRLKFESILFVPGYDIRIDNVLLQLNSW